MRALGVVAALIAWGMLGDAAAAPLQHVAIYPSGPSVPENLLRIELRFETPLQIPLRVDDVALVDGRGEPIRDAFLDLDLPSADDRRVTLLMHPARVKSGIGANERLGRALHPGDTVTLVVVHPSLAHPAMKRWHVIAFDSTRLRPGAWHVDPPRGADLEPVVVRLDKPVAESAEDLVAIVDAQGRRVPGYAQLRQEETVWQFQPSRRWKPGSYSVLVHPDLEDPAGNRVCAAFEEVAESRASCGEATSLPFRVR